MGGNFTSPMLPAAEFFRRLSDFESLDLLRFRFSFQDMLIWPAVRWAFVSRSLETNFGFLPTTAPPTLLSNHEKISYLYNVLRRRPLFAIRPYDILWFGSSLGVAINKGGKWLGRVNDYLINAHPEGTLLIEESNQKRLKYPRCVSHLRVHDWIRIKAGILSRFTRPSIHDRKVVDEFIEFIKSKAPVPLAKADYQRMQQDLLRLASRLPYLHAHYSELYRKVRPRLVFLEDACYGYQSYILRWAKDAGIRTAEFQHGVVVPCHPAYNYGPIGFAPAYRPYLPDTILTHGSFWNRGIQAPCATFVIGNPHFSTKLAERIGTTGRTVGRRLLIVSQADVTDRLVSLVHELRSLDPELEIVFRLHPAEVSFSERFQSLEGMDGVSISKSGDIYDLIDSSDWIVGVSSTVLFEAVGLRRPVFVYDTPQARLYIPEGFGTWFNSATDLLARVLTPSSKDVLEVGDVWAEDWEVNYLRFLASEQIFPIKA